jgi:hypothetical protein
MLKTFKGFTEKHKAMGLNTNKAFSIGELEVITQNGLKSYE